MEQEKAPTVMKIFVQQLLCVFHGNASVERSFSINKECLVENLHNDSLVAQRIVYDAVNSVGGISNLAINKALIHSVRNASARRVEAAKKRAAEKDAAATKRKRIAEEIRQLEAKKTRIEQRAKDESSCLSEELKKLRDSLKE